MARRVGRQARKDSAATKRVVSGSGWASSNSRRSCSSALPRSVRAYTVRSGLPLTRTVSTGVMLPERCSLSTAWYMLRGRPVTKSLRVSTIIRCIS